MTTQLKFSTTPQISAIVSGFAKSQGISQSQAIKYLIKAGAENLQTAQSLIEETRAMNNQFNRIAGLIISVLKQAGGAKQLSKAILKASNLADDETISRIEAAGQRQAIESLRKKSSSTSIGDGDDE